MKISIVGAGSIGLLYGYYLADKHEVTYYIRNEKQIDVINELGIALTNNIQTKRVKADYIKNYKKHDLLILALKQTELKSFINENLAILKQQPILFLQNGLNHLEYINNYKLEAIIGIVEHGAVKKGNNEVSHLGQGSTKIANYSQNTYQLEEIISNLNDKTLNFIYYKDWKEISYEKLIVNAVINPLTALFDVPNGEIINNQELNILSQNICKEASEILKLDFDEQWENIKRVSTLTSQNTSSMRSDLAANRKTEIDAIVGYLLMKSNLNSPYLNFIFNSIKYLERRGEKDA